MNKHNKKYYKRGYSSNYKRKSHPLYMRLVALWRVLTCRNFILIDFKEFIVKGMDGRDIRTLYRSNYDSESELNTLYGAIQMKKEDINNE